MHRIICVINYILKCWSTSGGFAQLNQTETTAADCLWNCVYADWLAGSRFVCYISTLILKALLKPLAKKPPKGPMMEAKEESAMLWIWNG